MSGNFFRGTTHDQDARYNNVEKKLLSKMSFAKVLSTKVGMGPVVICFGGWGGVVVLVLVLVDVFVCGMGRCVCMCLMGDGSSDITMHAA